MSKNSKEGSYAPAFEQSRKKLKQLLPEKVSESALLCFDRTNKCFTIKSFGQEFAISYPEGQVIFQGQDKVLLSLDWELILLNYLSSAKEMPLKNEWVSYRELPQGNVFFPHIRNNVLEVLGRFFSDCDKNLLRDVLTKLGFDFTDTRADIAATAEFAPRVPVFIQFWEGEEDIPSSCQILFDRTISEQMHIEDAAALCILVKGLVLKEYSLEQKV